MVPRTVAWILALVVALGAPALLPASTYAEGPGEPTTLEVSWPGATVRQGRAYVVTGSVSGGPRPVLVQRRVPGGWFPLGRDQAGADGRFSIRVDTRWVARHGSIRVWAPPTDLAEEAVATRTGGLTVTRSHRPRGGSAWRPLRAGDARAMRWSPCGYRPGVITYRVNHRGLPRGGLAEVKRAFAQLTAATGFTFRYLGRTTLVPLRNGSGTISRNADITIAYATPRQVPALRGPVLATTPTAAGFAGTSTYRILQAATVLDRTAGLRPGFGGGRRASRGKTLLHELGHQVGLAHVGDRRQVMYPSPTTFSAQYARGDLKGLAKVGVGAGCFPGEAVGGRRAAGGGDGRAGDGADDPVKITGRPVK